MLDWLTSTAVTSTATQMTADGRSPHLWRSIQGQYRVELQKVQPLHSAHPGAMSGLWTEAESSIPDSHAEANEGRSAFTTSLRTCTF